MASKGGVDVTEQGGVTIVTISGHLDASSSPALEQTLKALLEQGKKALLLQLAGLDYISSAGMRVFLMLYKHLQSSGGELGVCQLREQVMDMFEITGFVGLFRIFISEEEALSALEATDEPGI